MVGALTLLAAAGAIRCGEARALVFRVSSHPLSAPIAPDFLGLSLEYRSIPLLTGPDLRSINPVLVQLIRNLVPTGHPSLRIGGQSADRTWWPVRGARQPLGITYNLTPRWMTTAATLAQATNARLILGLGLEANQPRIDAVEASHLLSGLGRKYIAAWEIGNEPELYTAIPWYRQLKGAVIPWYSYAGVPLFSRPPGYTPASFDGEFRRVLRVLPRRPIAGPDSGSLSWLNDFRQFVTPASPARIITWHAYGLNRCVTDRSSPQYPTVPNLLSLSASRSILNGIAPALARAHRFGATFRVDEINSVTCNGRLGVSNTFASALWVMDALFNVAASNVDGVNIHTYQDAANGLFDFTRAHGHWQGSVHPLYYGVAMFAHAAPPGSRLLSIGSGTQGAVRAWATLAPDRRVRVLLINDSLTRSARAQVLGPGAGGPASVERLQAPSAYATGGTMLGGESFATRTQTGLLAPARTSTATPGSGGYALTLPAASAALVTLPAGAKGPGSGS